MGNRNIPHFFCLYNKNFVYLQKINIMLDTDIVKEYKEEKLSIEKICKKYHIGKLKVKKILYDNNIILNKKGGVSKNIIYKVKDYKIKKYQEIEGYHFIAKDKKNGFETKDYDNLAGTLTTHIRETYNIKIPSLYERRKYYMITGDYWWEQWFDIISVKNNDTKKCPYCHWETNDLKNLSGAFVKHLYEKHNKTVEQYLNEFPEEKYYFSFADKTKNTQLEKDESKFVCCKVCGKKLSRINSCHLKKHGLTVLEYIKKYGSENRLSKEYMDKCIDSAEQMNKHNFDNGLTFESKNEIEIKDFILGLGIECYKDRKILNGRELDIYIPEKNIAIEYNGLIWHSEFFGHKDKNYHFDKMIQCHNKGVKLITIFEDEFINNKEIVLNKIKHILNIEDKSKLKIDARKCVIKEVEKNIAKEFLNKNHIQGNTSASIRLGAYFNDELIGVMCFIKEPRNNWNLVRFATDNNYICRGVGGKLFKYFVRNYKFNEIKTFADRRWTIDEENNLYIKLGFRFDSYIKPSYSYYNKNINKLKRIHKFNLRKSNLRKMGHFETDMTETEMAYVLGFDRIWDCGLIKYIYKNSK